MKREKPRKLQLTENFKNLTNLSPTGDLVFQWLSNGVTCLVVSAENSLVKIVLTKN